MRYRGRVVLAVPSEAASSAVGASGRGTMALDPSIQTVPEIVLCARERFGSLPAMTLRDPRRVGH